MRLIHFAAAAAIVATIGVIATAPSAEAKRKYRIACTTEQFLSDITICMELTYRAQYWKNNPIKPIKIDVWNRPHAKSFREARLSSHKKSWYRSVIYPDVKYDINVGRLKAGRSVTFCAYPRFGTSGTGSNPIWGAPSLSYRACIDSGPLR